MSARERPLQGHRSSVSSAEVHRRGRSVPYPWATRRGPTPPRRAWEHRKRGRPGTRGGTFPRVVPATCGRSENVSCRVQSSNQVRPGDHDADRRCPVSYPSHAHQLMRVEAAQLLALIHAVEALFGHVVPNRPSLPVALDHCPVTNATNAKSQDISVDSRVEDCRCHDQNDAWINTKKPSGTAISPAAAPEAA